MTRGADAAAHTAISILSIPLFLAVWELVARSRDRQHRAVSAALGRRCRDGRMDAKRAVLLRPRRQPLPRRRQVSCRRVDWASFSACLTGQFPLVSSLLSPMFHILRPIPPIAFVPIVILWFGLSETGKLFLVVWGVFFTVWLSTHIGVQKVDRGLIRAALMLGTPRRQMLQEIVLLGALPYIVVGLRTAVSISFYTLVAAELAGTFRRHRLPDRNRTAEPADRPGDGRTCRARADLFPRRPAVARSPNARCGGDDGRAASTNRFDGAVNRRIGRQAEIDLDVSISASYSIPPQARSLRSTAFHSRVSRGEFVCIVGPSGCGKSTVLNASPASKYPMPAR